MKCPVCSEYEFAEHGDYDICHNCLWENDGIQFDKPNESGGANYLSLNQYKELYNKLCVIMPKLIEKYNISVVEGLIKWKFGALQIPRENVRDFVNQMTKNNIYLRINFYNIARKFKLNMETFVGYVDFKTDSVKANNDKILEFIFTDKPIEVCKQHGLNQLLKLLKKSKYVISKWQELTPTLDIEFY